MTQRVKKQTAKSKSTQAAVTASSNDNVLWMMGFVLLIVGVISFFSVLSHFLHWASDLSALRNDEELSGVVVPFENICSSMGAHIANWFVDCSFGVFGIITVAVTVLPMLIQLLMWIISLEICLTLSDIMGAGSSVKMLSVLKDALILLVATITLVSTVFIVSVLFFF